MKSLSLKLIKKDLSLTLNEISDVKINLDSNIETFYEGNELIYYNSGPRSGYLTLKLKNHSGFISTLENDFSHGDISCILNHGYEEIKLNRVFLSSVSFDFEFSYLNQNSNIEIGFTFIGFSREDSKTIFKESDMPCLLNFKGK